ncbi:MULTISPECIES: LysR family transcriptional regulator [Alloalcanivorax]|jgi:LysR family transcriptional regulator, transcription activator of glutamate synthase operon|uniref:LysR family transcriptional regulator n=2 Tax=Alloalcanivorax TaxID=3020832 RepID=A0A9Q3W3R0_9GAMM|nr:MULTISPECIES: LysR family transcriptional regulator [Alloalcanivorax]KYZ87580.1 LysR family transcriptional regulator [Alcanivorax sp. KX64203]PHS61331.1 MAG: LysR family transcriptional regulator [Alcanivorax sp.]ARB46393.1 LysR family transcriptional regulator [Alloalcanivorax xenomutans]MCE7507787.1 LysR family transcriptional regulator [Alloalcanivorax xenomutans]MCE7521459.1 LysR family transcriptional regulator [Alloalcanivorax xenomutans]
MDTPDRQLRCFVHIAELKSLSKAAEELNRTQSWISKELAALETGLGKSLFTRTGRGVVLTEAGEKLYEVLKLSYQQIDQAVDAIRQEHGITRGTVRLATVHTLSYYFMSDVVASFVSKHPSVNLSLLGRSSPEVVELVESGKADLGFVYDSAVASRSLNSQPLFDDDMCLITHQESALGVDGSIDLNDVDLRLVGFPSHYALRRMLQSGGLKPIYVAEAETIDAMLKLVSSDVGACILPGRIPDALLADYQLRKVRIVNPLLRRKVVAISPGKRSSLPLAEDLLQCALRICRQLT